MAPSKRGLKKGNHAKSNIALSSASPKPATLRKAAANSSTRYRDAGKKSAWSQNRFKWSHDHRLMHHLLAQNTATFGGDWTNDDVAAVWNELHKNDLAAQKCDPKPGWYFMDQYNSRFKEGRASAWKVICAKQQTQEEWQKRERFIARAKIAALALGIDWPVEDDTAEEDDDADVKNDNVDDEEVDDLEMLDEQGDDDDSEQDNDSDVGSNIDVFNPYADQQEDEPSSEEDDEDRDESWTERPATTGRRTSAAQTSSQQSGAPAATSTQVQIRLSSRVRTRGGLNRPPFEHSFKLPNGDWTTITIPTITKAEPNERGASSKISAGTRPLPAPVDTTSPRRATQEIKRPSKAAGKPSTKRASRNALPVDRLERPTRSHKLGVGEQNGMDDSIWLGGQETTRRGRLPRSSSPTAQTSRNGPPRRSQRQLSLSSSDEDYVSAEEEQVRTPRRSLAEKVLPWTALPVDSDDEGEEVQAEEGVAQDDRDEEADEQDGEDVLADDGDEEKLQMGGAELIGDDALRPVDILSEGDQSSDKEDDPGVGGAMSEQDDMMMEDDPLPSDDKGFDEVLSGEGEQALSNELPEPIDDESQVRNAIQIEDSMDLDMPLENGANPQPTQTIVRVSTSSADVPGQLANPPRTPARAESELAANDRHNIEVAQGGPQSPDFGYFQIRHGPVPSDDWVEAAWWLDAARDEQQWWE